MNFCRENSWGSFIAFLYFFRIVRAPFLRTRCLFTNCCMPMSRLSLIEQRGFKTLFSFQICYVIFPFLFYPLACESSCLDFKLLRFVGNSINVSIFIHKYVHKHIYCLGTKANGVQLRHCKGLSTEFGTGKLLSAEIRQVCTSMQLLAAQSRK